MKSYHPALFISLFLVLSMGAIHMLQIVYQREVYYDNRIFFGADYIEFYQASNFMGQGLSPYSAQRYVTPPLAALINQPLARLEFPLAAFVFFVLSLAALIVAYALVYLRFFGSGWEPDLWVAVGGVIAMLFSYPVFFLLDRGNIDAIVILGVFACVCLIGKNDWLAGAALGFSIGLKAYPVFLLLPLVVGRRYKALLGVLLAGVIMLSVTGPEMWLEYVTGRVFERGSQFRMDENGSIAVTFVFLGKLAGHLGLILPENVIVWLSTLYLASLAGLMIYADIGLPRGADEPTRVAGAMMYIPLMPAIPMLAYHYELSILLPLIPMVSYLWVREGGRASRWALSAAVIGLSLSQMHAVALEKLFAVYYVHFIPGFGLFLTMTGFAAYKLAGAMRLSTSGRAAPIPSP